MKLNTIRPIIETEDLLLSITKNCETVIEQTHRKAEQTLEFKLTKPRETFHFNPLFSIQGSWMLGLTSLEVYNSLCNKSKQNNKFELLKGIFTEFTFMDLKKELEEIFNIEDIKLELLQDHKIGPLIFKFFEKLKSEKSTTDAYLILLANYARSPF